MIRSRLTRRAWFFRLAAVAVAAIVIPACGRTPLNTTQPYSISTSTLPAGVVGVPYAQALTTVSETAPVTWSILGGSLPPGLTLGAATGNITGTPTGSANATTVLVRAVDAAGQVAQKSFLVSVTGGAPAPLAVTTATPLPGGDLGTAYQFGFSASGGAPTYAWSITAGALPTGLVLNPANGGLTGTPALAGTFNFTVQVADTALATASLACQLTISNVMVITGATMPAGSVGGAYSQSPPVINGSTPFLYSVSAGSLPLGLALNPTTGVISGVPTLAATSGYTVRVTDAAGNAVLVSLTHVINPAPVVTPVTPAASTQGLAYNLTLAATLGTGAYSWTVSAGALPNGLSLSAGGVISGTSTLAGTYNFTVTVTDAANGTGSLALQIVINPPVTITPITLAAWTVNQTGYSQTISANGGTGTPPFAWSVTVGTLPAGMTLAAATGVISGTPTAIGTSNFTVTATDSLGATGSLATSITINALPTISTATLPDWTIGRPYSQAVAAGPGGTLPFGWSVTVGTLPAGLSLAGPTGAITGTPTTAASSSFTVQIADAAGATVSQAYTVVINPAPTVQTTTLPNWTVGQAYNQALSLNAGTGTGPITWSIFSGTQPTGLSLSGGGILSGTPTATGPFTFTVRATDAAGATVNQTYTNLTINPLPTIATALPDWTVGRPYSQTILTTAATGTPAFTWSLFSGTPPTGLSLSSAGVLSGTPSATGPFTFTVRVTDAAGATANRTYTNLTINPVPTIATATLPDWTITRPYSQTLTTSVNTGTAPFNWAITTGTAPTPLLLSAGGVLSGTPNATGPSTFTVTVTDAAGATATQTYSNLTINPLPTFQTTSVPDWTSGRPYNQTLNLTAATGTAPFTFAVTGGSLPTGINLTTAGVLNNTPTAPGTYSFTVTATDAAGATVAQSFNTVKINPPPSIASAVGDWTVNRPLSVDLNTTMTASTGTPPFSWSVTSGSLPAGITVTAPNLFGGTPTAAGTSTFQLTVTDAAGATAVRNYVNYTINPTPTIATATLPDWTLAAAYTPTLLVTTATGTAPFSWSLNSGTLPTGLTLTSAGAFTGTPSATGPFTFTVTVTDLAGAAANQTYTNLTINLRPTLSTSTLAAWTQGKSGYSQQLTGANGTGALTFSAASGSFPASLSFPSSGLITGTPTDPAGDYTFGVLVTDSVGGTSATTPNLTITINPPLVITSSGALTEWTNLQAGYAGGTAAVTATGGTGTRNWTITSGALPAGLTLNAATGAITGTPNVTPGTFNFSVQVQDSVNATAAAPVAHSIKINPPPSFTGPLTLQGWTVNRPGYPATTAATGGTGTLTWSNPGGLLPSGLSLNTADGSFTGTPTGLTGPYSFQIRVQDTTGAFSQQTFSLQLNPAVQLTTPASLPDAAVLNAYTQPFSTSGGTPPFTWSSNVGASIPGVTFNTGSGVLSGLPTTGGTYTFNVTVTDNAGSSHTVGYSLFVLAPLQITTASLPGATVSTAYAAPALAATGGRGSYSWTLQSGTLPGTISFDGGGVWSGTAPSGNGKYTFGVRVTDIDGRTADQTLSISVTGAPGSGVFILTTTLNDGTQGAPYLPALTGTGGDPSLYQWSLSSGSLPTGLTLTSAGTFTGTPSASGLFNFQVGLTDGSTGAFRNLSININTTLTGGTVSPMQEWTVNAVNPYPQNLSVNGGTAPVSYVKSGSVPTGLTLGSDGTWSGTPTSPGTYFFSVQITDAAGATASQSLSIKINPAPLINVFGLPPATQNASYPGATFNVGGGTGTAPFTWTSTPTPPTTGMTLSSGGVLSGTPTVAGTVNPLSVTVTDAAGVTDNRSFTLIVNTPATITTTTLPAANQGQAYPGAQLQATGGSPPYTWSNPAGLPTGLSIDAAGNISGTTSDAPGSYPFTAQLTDSGNGVVTKGLSIDVTTGPTVVQRNIPDGNSVGRGVNIELTFSMDMNPATFTTTGGSPSVILEKNGVPETFPILQFWRDAKHLVLVFDTQSPAGIFGNDLLDAGKNYTLTLTTAIKSVDPGGLNMGTNFVTHWSTYTQQANPTFTVDPPLGDPIPALNTEFTLTFDRAMDTGFGEVRFEGVTGNNIGASITDTFPTGGVASMSFDGTQKVLTVTLQAPLPLNSMFRFRTDSFRDTFGASVNGDDQTVVATPGPAGTPRLTGILPSSAAPVSRDSEVIVGFKSPMWPSDLLDPANVVCTAVDTATSTPIDISGMQFDRQVLEFAGLQLRPHTAWPPDATITVTVKSNVRGSNGTTIGVDQNFTFMTVAGDTSAFLIDPDYSGLTTGATLLDTGGIQTRIKLMKPGGARARLNRDSLSPADVTLQEHDSPFVPLKGFTLDARHGLEIRSEQDFTGMANLRQYDLIFNPTLVDSLGSPMSVAGGANILSFTTRDVGDKARPQIYGTESQFNQEQGKITADLSFSANSPSNDTLNLSLVDSAGAFNPTFSPLIPGGSNEFHYNTEDLTPPNNDDEPTLTANGLHVLTYSVTNGTQTVTIKDKAWRFDTTKYPTLSVPTSPATSQPTLTWTALDPALGVDGMALGLMKDDGLGNFDFVYVALIPTTATSFTFSSDQALPAGDYKYILHFFHNPDGSFDDVSSEANTDPSTGTFTVVP